MVTFQTALVAEKSLRKDVVDRLNMLVKQYNQVLGDTSHFRYFSELDESKILVGKLEFGEVRKIVGEFAQIVSSKSAEISAELGVKVNDLKRHVESWKSREAEITKKIEDKKTELTAAGIPIDIAMINKLANDLNYY